VGLLDIFRMGKVIAGTVKSVRNQRDIGKKLSALPIERFVPECLSCLNQSAGNWQGRARQPNESGATIAKSKQLPDELVEFYGVCDGFETVQGDFPACVYPVGELHLGATHSPTLSSLLESYWEEHGNDSEKPGLLSVLPPDDLAALATHSADSYLRPSSLDLAVPLCPPMEHDFVAILLADSGENLPRGTVLEVEGGSATRYPSFKSWLGTRASLFASLQGLGNTSGT
jgi:hypothetical protein